jgi:hypothetical protein
VTDRPRARGEAPPGDRVNARQLAELLGVRPNAISAAKKAGRIHVGPDGLYDAEAAMAEFRGSRARAPGPGRGHVGGEQGSEAILPCPTCGNLRDLQYWKTKREREAYLAARLDRLELQGRLVRREDAERAQAAIGSMMRAFLESIGPDLRDELAAEDSPARCGELVATAIRVALERAAEQIGKVDDEGFDEVDDDLDP